MKERSVRRERRERLLQAVAFGGALLILAFVVYASVLARQHERTGERLLTALPVPSVRPTLLAGPTWLPGPAGSEYRWVTTMMMMGDLRSGRVRDPAHLGSPWDPQGFFLGLTRRDSGWTTAYPLLARTWEVSEEGLVYTFHLRDDVSWVRCHQGGITPVRPVSADDVIFAIQRVLRPGTKAVGTGYLYPIRGARERFGGDDSAPLGVEALDPLTVRFTLITPTQNFPARLAEPLAWPVPRELVEQYGETWTEPENVWVNGQVCPLPGREGSIEFRLNTFLPHELSYYALSLDRTAPLIYEYGTGRVMMWFSMQGVWPYPSPEMEIIPYPPPTP